MINHQNNVNLNFCSFLPFCNSIGMLRLCVLTYFFKSYHHFFKSAVLWVLDITIFANHLITSLAEGNPFYLTRNQKVANKPLAARQ